MEQRSPFAFRFSICGFHELKDFYGAGVSHVLSILDPDISRPADLLPFMSHQRLELRFNDIVDECDGKVAPQREHIERLLDFGRAISRETKAPPHILIHCHAGLSRSTAAMILLLAQARPDVSADDVFAEIVKIRPNAWPNLRMIELGDALLARNGQLIDAARRHYARAVARDPELRRTLIMSGRGREVS